MKKIMLAITRLTGGGAERVVSVWASELSEAGYDVSVLLAGREQNEYPLSDKVQVHTISPTYREYCCLSQWDKIRGRREILKKVRPDYLISFLPYIQQLSMVTAAGLGIKRIETVRISPWHASANKGMKKFLWMLCFATGYKTILQSSDQANYFCKSIQKKCVIIPNPIPEIYYENYKENFSDRVQRFIAAGRICEQKNYDLMIRGFAGVLSNHKGDNKYDSLVLDIYGDEDGMDRTKLQKLIEELDMEKNIFLKGRVAKLQERYINSDAFIMTSNYEGMPNALVEAMASGLVCISTDCKTGPRDLIDDGENGFLIPVGDVDALTNTLDRVMALTMEERMAMGKCAREKVLSCCSKVNSLHKLIEIFEK